MPANRELSPPQSLCILRLSAIGDVTHMLPVIATLQQQWPQCKITWIIGKVEHQLVKSLSDIEFIVFDKSQGWKGYMDLRQRMKGRQFDVLLMMQVALRANLISTLIPAKIKIGYDRQRSRDMHQLFCNRQISGPARVHVLDTFFQFIEALGITARHMDWLLTAPEPDKAWAKQLINGNPTIIINPCSSARKNNWRNWPEAYYAELIDWLLPQGVQVILSGGPATEEKAFADRVQALCRQTTAINLVGKTSLMQLLALLEQARCLIAPDTGPAHMGTIAGTPVIGLFASSNPQRSGPYNSQNILVNAYPEALHKYNGKTLQQARWGERVRHSEVMQMISVEQVRNKLIELDLLSHEPLTQQ